MPDQALTIRATPLQSSEQSLGSAKPITHPTLHAQANEPGAWWKMAAMVPNGRRYPVAWMAQTAAWQARLFGSSPDFLSKC